MPMEHENLGENKDFVRATNSVVDAGQKFVKIAALQYEDNCQRLIMAVACMAGPHMALSAILSQKGTDKPVTEEHGLLAALMVRHCIEHTNGNKHFALTYDIQCVIDAMADFEKLTGKKPDSLMNEDLVAAAREVEKEGAGMLDAFLAARPPSTPPN